MLAGEDVTFFFHYISHLCVQLNIYETILNRRAYQLPCCSDSICESDMLMTALSKIL